MKKITLLTLAMLLISCGAMAQKKGTKSKKKETVQPPTLVSVGEIMGNYGIDTAWLGDTVGIMQYLDSQEQNYVELTNLCVSIKTRVQKAISSIENDYPMRDSLIWLDSNTVLSDYPMYEYWLNNLSELMGQMSSRYTQLEKQRIEAEKEAARLRAIEEARRIQEAKNKTAVDLRSNIELHHRAVMTACDGAGITDKAKLKELKDLYYSYLMVYNKYDLSETDATDEKIAKLDELNAFQNDMLDKVLGQNSLPYQIENFKNILKVRCEKGNNDIYRSYTKVFKHTTVPISFADVKEYEDYINKMHTVINVQQRYLQTIDLRGTIATNSDLIVSRYNKKYKAIASSYKEVARNINTLPSFTTNAESVLFIDGLEQFIEAQKLYLDFYAEVEEITQRSDTIIARCQKQNKLLTDVVANYREIKDGLMPIPTFSDPNGATLYEARLEESRQVQQAYMDVIRLRLVIANNDDTIFAARKLDKVLANGYKILRKQTDLTPTFSTVERGRSFIDILDGQIDMQNICLATIEKLRTIQRIEKTIKAKNNPYKNITKAYTRLYKAYYGMSEITNTEDLRRFSRQCDYIIEMQNAIVDALHDPTAADIDAKLRKESAIDKIKLIIGME